MASGSSSSSSSSDDISLIVPYIYIGSRHAAIGHVISVLTDHEYADYMIAAEDFEDQKAWYRLVADDDPAESISRFFPQMTRIIADAVAAKQAVLVHCAAGMSRSVTIVTAYLIADHGLTAAEAVAYIKKRRPIAEPNRGFMRQLEAYYNSLYFN